MPTVMVKLQVSVIAPMDGPDAIFTPSNGPGLIRPLTVEEFIKMKGRKQATFWALCGMDDDKMPVIELEEEVDG